MTDLMQIFHSVRCDRTSNDRRRWPRVGLRERVTLRTLDDRSHAAWLRDISEGGAGLLVGIELRVDSSVVVDLPTRDDSTLPVRCRVAHCAKVGGFWRAGLEFVEKPWHQRKATILASNSIEEDLELERRRLSSAVVG